MTMNRRTWLKGAAATPFVFGLGDLFAQEAKISPPWIAEALKLMNESGRYGVVLIVPDKKDEQLPLGQGLAALIDGDDRAAHAVLCEAVFICVRHSHAEGRFCEIGDRNTRYLIDPSGKRVAADMIEEKSLEDAGAFKVSFGPFLRGKDGERLRQRAEVIRNGLSPEAKAAVENLDAEEIDVREQASALLLKQADRIMPFLVELSLNATPVERRGRAADVIEAYFRLCSTKAVGPRLPYGCKIPVMVNAGCNLLREKEDGEKESEMSIMVCGMGRASKETRRFLSFLKE